MKILSLLFLLAFGGSFAKNTPSAASAKTADIDASVKNYVDSVLSKSLQLLHAENSSEQKLKQVREFMEANFDFERMVATILRGKASDKNSIDEFSAVYKKYFIDSYSKLILDYVGAKIYVRSINKASAGMYFIKAEVDSPDKEMPLNMDFWVRLTPSGYKVADVVTEGISLVKTHEAEFGDTIAQKGLKALINQLRSKS